MAFVFFINKVMGGGVSYKRHIVSVGLSFCLRVPVITVGSYVA